MYCGCMKKDNKTEQIDGADIQFEYVSDGAAQQLKYSQNSFYGSMHTSIRRSIR